MRPLWNLIKRSNCSTPQSFQRRSLLTLAIETSCDDTSVAVLEQRNNRSSTLHYHAKITSDNRSYGGVHPIAAHESHQQNLAKLVNEALKSLPSHKPSNAQQDNAFLIREDAQASTGAASRSRFRQKPDFVTVARGPGMRSSLLTGMDTAKGLAVAWQVPLLGVNHMQAHALTPRLVSTLDTATKRESSRPRPAFPFLTLLVSGGHTMLVHSKELCNHEILANTTDMAIGDALDKSARDILPPSVLEEGEDVMYGRLLESFAFPDEKPVYKPPGKPYMGFREGFDWVINPPFMNPGTQGSKAVAHEFSYSGIGSSVKQITTRFPDMGETERRVLAREAMRIAFEHLASRVIFALESPELHSVKTLVVSGGVASNNYLKYVLRRALDKSRHFDLELVFPPLEFCTDNAAMIAWAGIEMYREGWRSDLDVTVAKRWSVDRRAHDGGILGIGGWTKAAMLST